MNKKTQFLIIVLVLFAVFAGYSLRSLVQNRKDLQTQIDSIPIGERVLTAIWEKSQILSTTLPNASIELNPDGPLDEVGKTMWWVSNRGYAFYIQPTSYSIIFRPSKIPTQLAYTGTSDTLSLPGVKDFFKIAVAEFEKNDFIKNEINSSSSYSDLKLWDYAQSYEKYGTKCTITTGHFIGSPQDSINFSPQVITTCVDWQEDQYYESQKPFLELLGLRFDVSVSPNTLGFPSWNIGAIMPGYGYNGDPSGANGVPIGDGDFNQVPIIFRDGREIRRVITKRTKVPEIQGYRYEKIFDTYEGKENISCEIVKKYQIPQIFAEPCE
ncbi:MAG: hypothetical protein AAB569_07090 [Patescibacteria group bacterium]